MKIRSLAAAAVVVTLACVYGSPAFGAERSAEQRTAAKEFAAGERAFSAGDYRRAAESFEAAYRASPHHAPLWNAARPRTIPPCNGSVEIASGARVLARTR